MREAFAFTDRERNGTLVLLFLIVGLLVFMSVQERFVSLPPEDFSQFDRFVASVKEAETRDSVFAEQEKNSSPFPDVAQEAGTHSVYHSKELFNFDPNHLPEDDWVRLGLSPAQARSVKNFEAKGGSFRTKEDVKKLFVISAERYRELEPYIVLPEKLSDEEMQQSTVASAQKKPVKIPVIVELNTADSADLVALKGIGPAFAKRILEYRERLGGYSSKEQLHEVFGIDSAHFESIKDLVKADPSYIRKISINGASAAEFKKLPYISWNVANGLVNYRKAHGLFKSVEEVRGCALVTPELYSKISPYLGM